MLERYVDVYMSMMKIAYKNFDELNGETICAMVDTQFLDIKEVKNALVSEISKYYGVKKQEVNKLLNVEEMLGEGGLNLQKNWD